MHVIKKSQLFLLAAILLATLCSLVGCVAQEKTGFGPDVPVSPATVVSDDVVVGTASQDAQVVVMTNYTGNTITDLKLKLTTDTSFGNSLISQDWKNGQDIRIYFSKDRIAATNSSNALFVLQLSFTDGTLYEVTDVSLFATVGNSLRYDKKSQLVYLEFASPLGLKGSTLEGAKAIQAEALEAIRLQAEAEAAAAALAEAEAAAAAEAEAQAEASGGGYSYDPVYSGGGGSSLGQTDDSCVGNELLLN